MAVKIKFDNAHNVIPPTFVLATRSGKKLGSIPAENISVSDAFNSRFELSFQVWKEYDGAKIRLWDDIVDFKLIWCREWDVWFEIYVTTKDDSDTVKFVSCVSLGEAELSQIILNGIEINTENDIAREDYEPTILYNKDNHNASLLNRIMEKCPHYSIRYVSPSIADIQRTFKFDGNTLYDAFQEIAEEIDCIFVIDSGSNDDGSIRRSISVFDLEAYCVACGERGHFLKTCSKCGNTNIILGYGDDTAIFVSTENLADDITVKVNTTSVKNCFRLVAGDDLMTAAIINCNPNGSQYIWYLSKDMKSDMSDSLVSKLDEYDSLYDYYYKEHIFKLPVDIVTAYNNLVAKYKVYEKDLQNIKPEIKGYPSLMSGYFDTIDLHLLLRDGLMPSAKLDDTTAAAQAALLHEGTLSPVAVSDINTCSTATVSSMVLSAAKVIVDQRYRVKVKDGTFNGEIWTGKFIVSSYSDENDTAESGVVRIVINDDYERFVKQKIDNVLKNVEKQNDVTDIASLFSLSNSKFATEIKKYCLSSLGILADSCQACLDVLVKQGIADKDTWADKTPDMYTSVYLPFYEKLRFIEEETKLRESEIQVIIGSYSSDGELLKDGVQTLLEDEKGRIKDALNMENFLGRDLWLELLTYRREDTYTNDNFISDGLNNVELFRNAMEFIDAAQKEIYKSATQQHTLSANLKNLLVMKEFSPIVDKFSVGNWIRVKIDGVVYRLRMIRYQIDFDNLENIQVEFSDIRKFADGVSDSHSILSQAASMASSYGAVSHQASQGDKGNKQVNEWVNKGLALTKMKIIDCADNQNIVWDSHGVLCREKIIELDKYSDKQLKIINRGLYLTDDNWRTSKAGIGDFTFYDPATGKFQESYGVIADTLVGNLILSEKVGVYSKDNSIVLGENGLVITTNKNSSDTIRKLLFLIQKNTVDSSGQSTNQKLMYVDDYGNLVLNGAIKINASTNNNIGSLDDLSDDSRFDGIVNDAVNGAIKPFEEKFASLDVDINGIRGEIGTITQNFSGQIEGINGTINVINGQITGINGNIGSINGSLDGINGSIGDINGSLNGIYGDISGINNEIVKLTEKLDLKLGSDEVELKISQSITAGTKPLYDSIAALSGNATSLKAYVEETKRELQSGIDGKESDIAALKQKVEATMTSQEIQLAISNSLQNGVSKVETTTGFVFNEDGLTVSKTGQEMTTRITENGMIITQNQSEVLTANNIGVDAKNLHATTYLIVGNNSRFEDYKTNRTGCFYIGA